MLELKIHDGDHEVVLRFEHSLHSMSKWEQKNKKAFMATPMKNSSEMIDYFQYMLLEGNSNNIYRLSPEQLDELSNYINDPSSASTVPDTDDRRPSQETVTTELVYYWMTALKINWEAQYWHYNRLIMLIRITSYKQQPEKKRSASEMLAHWKNVQARNKEKFGLEG